jgi:rhodanese-related sulfurtransferase
MKNNQLLTASLIFFLVIVGGLFISIFANFYTGYKKPLKEVHNSIVKDDYVFSYLDLIDYLKNDNENITIVDLRSEEKYKNGHIESAINIPLKSIYENLNLNQLEKQKGGILLYADSQNEAAVSMLMLNSLGIDNVKILAGSYEVFNKYLVEDNNPKYYFYNEEKVNWSYSNFINTPEPEKKPDLEPMMIRAQGGC